MMDSFARLLRGLEIAVLLIFLVLVAQFGGPLAPLQMVLSIPLELSGVFIGLWLAHQAFSSVSILAVIILTGMDITTAILLLDQIRRRRAKGGRTRDEAIALACRDRLRPILMTALITIITMLPVALAPRTGMDAYQPLGTVIVSGLLAGTGLSLLVIPVMHALVDDLGRLMTWRRAAGAVIFLSALLTVAGAPARADMPAATRSLTLTQAIQVAQAGNPDLAQARAEADAATAATRGAAAQAKPSLSATTYATVGDSANILTSSPGVQPQNIFGVPAHAFADQDLMLMVPLSTGGRLGQSVIQARRQGEAAGFSVQAARLTLESQVTQTYARALLGQALVETAQARLTAEDEQVRVTSERVTVGRLAPVDLRREQAEQADARQALLAAQNDAAQALVDLKALLGLPQESALTLADTLDTLAAGAPSLPANVAEAVRLAQAHRPEMAVATARLDAAQAGAQSARGAYSPQVYAVAMEDAQSGAGTGRVGYTLGLTATLPLLDGGQRRADVDAADARRRAARADADKVRLQVAREAASAWLTLQTATAQIGAAQAGLAAAQEGYDLATLRYNGGKSLTAERLDALAALTRARGALAEAKAGLLTARASLSAALGSR